MGRRILASMLVPANALTAVAGVAIVVMMLHVTADVASKYLFDSPVENTLEIVSAYYMVLVIFLPLAYVSHHQGHIIVELFTRDLSPRRLALVEGAGGIIVVVFMAALTWTSVAMAVRKTAILEAWETAAGLVEVWPSRWVLPIGCGLMTIYAAYRMVRDFATAAGGDERPGAPPAAGGTG